MSKRRLSTLLTLFCIALVAWFLARTTFLLREPSPEQLDAAGRRTERSAAAPEPLGAFEHIEKRNLLGVAVSPPEKSRSAGGLSGDSEEERLSESGIHALPVSKRGWTLLGTIVDTEQGQSRAIIRIDGKDQPYREGEKLQGWTVAQVQRRMVVLAKGASRERLIMGDDLPKPDTRADAQKTISRTQLRGQLADIATLMRSVTVTPQTLGGYQGLRIAAIQPGSYIEELGLQKDDLLLGVNGKPLRSFGDVSGLGDLIDKSAITLEVLRNGKKTIIRYDVQS